MGIAETLKKTRVEEREISGLGKVRIRHLRMREVNEIEKLEGNEWVCTFLALAVVDEEGNGIFTAAADVNELSWPTIKALSDAAMAVNDLKAVTAEKNSATPPASG